MDVFRNTTLVLFIFFMGIRAVSSIKINAYHLNKRYDRRTYTCHDCYHDIECVRLDGNFSMPSKMTMCMRTFPYMYDNPDQPYTTVISMGTLNSEGDDYVEGFGYALWKSGPWIILKTKDEDTYSFIGMGFDIMDLQTWHHTCLSVDMESGQINLVENGRLSYEGVSDTLPPYYRKLSPTFETVAPGCIWRPDGTGYMSVYGQVTDFHVFSRLLSVEDMKNITGCKKRMHGDFIDWDREKWKLVGGKNTSELQVLDFEDDVCRDRTTSLHLLPILREAEPWVAHTCKKLSGRPATYDTNEEFASITRYMSNPTFRNSICATPLETENDYYIQLYLGTTDNEEEGTWRHTHNNKQLTNLDWLPNRPFPGGNAYNCLLIHADLQQTNLTRAKVTRAKVGDWACGLGVCGICHLDHPVRKVSVRGLCKNSMFNTEYFYNIDDNGNVLYLGEVTSFIIYDTDQEMWTWYDRMDNVSFASSKSTQDSMLLGVNNFEFRSVRHDACAKEGEPTVKKIKLTTCEKHQFTCNDGQCIDMEQRCDQTSNCLDESDEDNCRMIYQKDNYKKTVPPFSFDTATKTNIPVNVNVSFGIKDMLKIEEIDHIFVLKYAMIMEWYDFRLTYYNLKTVRSANSLASTEIERIWIPFVVFENTENNEATVGSKNTEVTITREGDFELSEPSVVEEINIFKGEANRITFQEVYTKTFKCEYQLQLYPFDKQVCTVVMAVRELERSTMMITPDQIRMEGETILTQYIIPYWSLGYVNSSSPEQGISMVIILKRRIMNEIMTTYLPTILILIIVYATNFFKAFFFEAVVTVNLTALLVLTTLFISVSGSLPPTAYVKMVDIWLIFAQMVPFFEVLLHTFIDSMRVEGDREINHHGRTIKVGSEEGDEDEKPSDIMGLGDNIRAAWHDQEVQKTYSRSSVGDTRLIARNEKEEVNARREFYEKLLNDDRLIKIGEFTARILIPCFVLSFVTVYWTYGLSEYMGDV